MPSESRQEIYDQIMSRGPHEIESLLAGWFVQAGKQVVDLTSINIGNIKEWLAWAFFMVPSTDQLELLELAELNLLVDQLSQKIGRKFEQGYNKSVKYDSTSNLRSLRINFDEPKIDHRPLILLILIWTIQYLGDLYLSSLFYTFVKYKTRNGGLFSYHVRFGENTDLPPLVLLHGMGIGVYIYALFVKEISKKYPNRTIFLVHLPHVASRLVSWESVSQSYVFASEVVQMLHSHGYQKAFFIGHSIGTIYANYMVKYTESVLGVLMIDPVCFRIFDPTLVYNFGYRKAKTPFEACIQYFVSRELYQATFITKRFQWQENTMNPNELPDNAVAVISLHDNLLNGHGLLKFATDHKIKTVHNHIDHAEFLVDGLAFDSVVEALETIIEHC